jgi:hypothetical protein
LPCVRLIRTDDVGMPADDPQRFLFLGLSLGLGDRRPDPRPDPGPHLPQTAIERGGGLPTVRPRERAWPERGNQGFTIIAGGHRAAPSLPAEGSGSRSAKGKPADMEGENTVFPAKALRGRPFILRGRWRWAPALSTRTSPRLSRLDETIISQCNSFLILRLVNPRDQSFVRSIMENLTESDARMIPGFGPGQGIISGQVVRFPLPVSVTMDRELMIADLGDEDFFEQMEEWEPDADTDARTRMKTSIDRVNGNRGRVGGKVSPSKSKGSGQRRTKGR